MNKTVFVSSTYLDLESYRRAVWDLLEGFQTNVRGMEQFGARTEAPLETCLAEIELSDIYVGLIAFRLGSVDATTGKSITHLEYERAYERQKEVLLYLMDEDRASIAPRFVDADAKREKLDAFRRLLRERHTVATFVSEEDLVKQLRRDFRRLLQAKSEGEPFTDDEFETSRRLIEKFLLMPKATTGEEVRLRIQARGAPFPASRAICTAFNLQFGAAVGIPVAITTPGDVDVSAFQELFLTAAQADAFLPVVSQENRDIYAKLQFADEQIRNSRARFRSEVEYRMGIMGSWAGLVQGERVVIEADGKTILRLTRSAGDSPGIVKNDSSPHNNEIQSDSPTALR